MTRQLMLQARQPISHGRFSFPFIYQSLFTLQNSTEQMLEDSGDPVAPPRRRRAAAPVGLLPLWPIFAAGPDGPDTTQETDSTNSPELDDSIADVEDNDAGDLDLDAGDLDLDAEADEDNADADLDSNADADGDADAVGDAEHADAEHADAEHADAEHADADDDVDADVNAEANVVANVDFDADAALKEAADPDANIEEADNADADLEGANNDNANADVEDAVSVDLNRTPSPKPQGASRSEGGVFRGRAKGNGFSFGDAGDDPTPEVVREKVVGRVLVYEDGTSNAKPRFGMKQDVTSSLEAVLVQLSTVHSPVRSKAFTFRNYSLADCGVRA
jgi:hypothetical protein